jgi:hypothetical protein
VLFEIEKEQPKLAVLLAIPWTIALCLDAKHWPECELRAGQSDLSFLAFVGKSQGRKENPGLRPGFVKCARREGA